MLARPYSAAVAALLLLPLAAGAQDRPPILDVHLHAYGAAAQGPPPVALCAPFEAFPTWDPAKPYAPTFEAMMQGEGCDSPLWSPETDEALLAETVAAMERFNVFGVLSGTPERVAEWREAAPGRFIPGLGFNVARHADVFTPDSVRALVEAGRLAVLAEVTNPYAGVAPADDQMAPYWALAEELDLPVGIHLGPGPPGIRHVGFDGVDMQARLSSALTMEPVLVRHPQLRVYLMHAGYPQLDDLLSLLYVYPNVYVDIGVIVATQPRPAFYRFLRGIVEAGFGTRVMFGSDQMVWPGLIERSIEVIEEAPFLSDEQKRDIFYHNAARFLRLSDEEIARHHGD